jgi:hypothetical protein
MGINVPLPVKYIHVGNLLVAGNAVGKVKLWPSKDGYLLDTLDHDGELHSGTAFDSFEQDCRSNHAGHFSIIVFIS